MFSLDSRTIATGSDDNNIHPWDVHTGKYQKTFIGHKGRVNSITFNPDGEILASGNGTVLLWGLH